MLRKKHRRCTGTFRRADNGAQVTHILQAIKQNQDRALPFPIRQHPVKICILIRLQQGRNALMHYAAGHVIQLFFLHLFHRHSLLFSQSRQGKQTVILLSFFQENPAHSPALQKFGYAVSSTDKKRVRRALLFQRSFLSSVSGG